MANNPLRMRFPFETQIAKLEPEVQMVHRTTWNAITDLQEAIPALKSQIPATASSTSGTSTSTTSTSSTSVTPQQAASIASSQAQAAISMTFGKVNPQTSSYTTILSDYGGIIQVNDASANALTLDGTTLPNQWFAFIENIGAGTVTVAPATGTINGVASITLVTNQSAVVFFDGVNWAAATSVPGGGGVISLDGITGAVTLIPGSGITITDNTPAAGDITIAATGAGVASLQGETGAITLTSSGATVTITTPTSSTINLEATGGSGLPVNNPTFTGIITGPRYASNGASPSAVAGATAGAGASATVTGNDGAGNVAVTWGTGATGGLFVTVTFTSPYSSAPIVIYVPTNSNASGIGATYISSTTTGFTLNSAGNASPAAITEFNYFVIET